MPRHSGAAVFASASVIAVTAGFYSYVVGHKRETLSSSYPLQAIFLSSNGLNVGADVRLGGVNVGSVSSITLDPATFAARVVFEVEDRYRLPADTSLGIGSSGLTASSALLINPGHSVQRLAPGATIRDTRDTPSLEQSVSQYIFGAKGLNDSGDQ